MWNTLRKLADLIKTGDSEAKQRYINHIKNLGKSSKLNEKYIIKNCADFTLLSEKEKDIIFKEFNFEVIFNQSYNTAYSILKKLLKMSKSTILEKIVKDKVIDNFLNGDISLKKYLIASNCVDFLNEKEIKDLFKATNFNSINELDLTGYKISKFPESIQHIDSLQTFVIDDYTSHLKTLPESIGKLISLQKLVISNVSIRNLPETFGNLKSLKTLILNIQYLKKLPESIKNLDSLQTLIIEGSYMEQFPEMVTQLKTLKTLVLKNFALGFKSLPESISNMKSLQKLEISDNKLKALPKSIGNLKSLKCLDLRRNELKSLPDSIGNLSSLEVLYLGENQITNIPISFSNLKSLQILDLWMNRLKIIPKSIESLTTLKKLNLGHVRAPALPDFIAKLSLLEELYLNNNDFESLPDTIGSLKNLRVLDLSFNNLVKLTSEINKLETLEVLDLGYNEINNLPDSIEDLKNLKILWIDNNKFETIPEVLTKIPNLEFLSFERNNVKNAPKIGDLELRDIIYKYNFYSSNLKNQYKSLVLYYKRIKIKERINPLDIIGCSEEEIKYIEKLITFELPILYREFLKILGNSHQHVFNDPTVYFDFNIKKILKKNIAKEEIFSSEIKEKFNMKDIFIIQDWGGKDVTFIDLSKPIDDPYFSYYAEGDITSFNEFRFSALLFDEVE